MAYSPALVAQLDDTSTVLATEDNYAPVRLTAQRGQHINLRNASGAEIGIAGAPLRIDPTGATTQPVSGTVTANAGTGTWTVDTELGAAVSLIASQASPSGPMVGGTNFLLDAASSNQVAWRTANNAADNVAGGSFPPVSLMLFNPQNNSGVGGYDRYYNNLERLLITDGTRTAGPVDSADQINYNHAGVMVVLNIITAPVTPGTGSGLTVQVRGKQTLGTGAGGFFLVLDGTGTKHTVAGRFVYVVHPATQSTGADVKGGTQFPVPRTWSVRILHGNADSYRYEVTSYLVY